MQMLHLIELFPHDELRSAPTPQPPGDAARISAKIDPHIHEDALARARELGISDRQLLESALTDWLASNA
jgi:hypothetical protein